MKVIVVASQNPVKAMAALAGFRRMFPSERFHLETLPVASGVSHQPTSSEETLAGAIRRASSAARQVPRADYWVGIEGGIEDTPQGMTAFAWIVVRSPALQGWARSATFFLPESVARLIRQGSELGDADDEVFGRVNSKQHDGAVGLLTGNVVDRRQLYEQAVVLALVTFKNSKLYGASTEARAG
jgi:inosine/xanthosine triphosphatase